MAAPHSLYIHPFLIFRKRVASAREPGRALRAYQKKYGHDGVWRGHGVALHLCLASYQRMLCVARGTAHFRLSDELWAVWGLWYQMRHVVMRLSEELAPGSRTAPAIRARASRGAQGQDLVV
jgi:hypothetical protein